MKFATLQRPASGTLVLDHVAHFVRDLDAAARTLATLGFTVTAPSAQSTQGGPAGTANVCVMLEAGYLEFLAPTGDTPTAARVRTALDRYAGVHLACFGTPAAGDEHARLAAQGFDPLPAVALSRPVECGGSMQTARFNVVRVPPERMPEGRIQYVEQLTPELLWQPRWLGHANGVTGLRCAFVVARNPIEAAARWARFAALLPRRVGAFVDLQTARGHVLIGRPADWRTLLGASRAAPALAGYALECNRPEEFAQRCRRAGLSPRRLRRSLYAVELPVAIGGAWVFGTRAALALE